MSFTVYAKSKIDQLLSLKADANTVVSQIANAVAGMVPSTRTINSRSLASDVTLTPADLSAVPTARTINGKALTADITLTASDVGASGGSADFGLLGVLPVDSFSGTDDQKLTAALNQVRADTYPRALQFSNRQWSFNTTQQLNRDGLKFIGPTMEREFRETNRLICPAGGLFQFNNSGYRDFLFRGLSFQASSSGVFMPAWATDSSQVHWDDVDILYCGFQGFSSIISGTVLRMKMDDIYINGATDTQLTLGGSDSSLFMGGMNFISGTIPSSSYYINMGMSSTDIKLPYITPQTGGAVYFSYSQGGIVVYGGKSDCTGRSGSLATQPSGIKQNIPSGRSITYRDVWVFNAAQNGTAKGLIEVLGGDAVFYSPNFPGTMTGTTPAVGSIPGIYAANGTNVRVYAPRAENSGYKHIAKQSGATVFCDDGTWTIDTVA